MKIDGILTVVNFASSKISGSISIEEFLSMFVSIDSDLEIMIGDEQLEPFINSTTPKINNIDFISRTTNLSTQ